MSPDSPETREGQPGSAEAALLGLCPRCGAKTMFAGMLAFAERCPTCELDYARFNVGDGPTALVTLAVGTITVALAVSVELSFGPSWWVHVLLWLPLTFALVIGGLRVTKAWLLASEYRNDAREAGSKEP